MATAFFRTFFSLPHIEPSPKRIRVLFGGKYIVDTTAARLVWTQKYYPYYYFPAEDLPKEYIHPAGAANEGELQRYDLVVGSRKAEAAVSHHLVGDLAGLINIEFSAVDAWFEEDEQIYQHPKDPYKRIEVLQSSRHIRIELNGVVIAETRRPRLLFETSLRTRTYIPMTDCRLDLFAPSALTTTCPYKGIANYYSVRLPDGSILENSVWYYRTPLAECIEIKGLLAFYDEKLDVFVDDVLQPR
ncbi:hypothetical protein BDY19DRAFT_888180 [Irpex rosettiformis]|uniref:Uncharacterized protein n=1 Tax=Irpex rosettiformis TaxID=378272 RepID=A0ACB8U7A6_9APHY|nr:hypothetical protein BDY19DRAFT_888180 [Irpex rosettiformis]